MKFLFKTLDKQLEESGFNLITNYHCYRFEKGKPLLCEYVLKEIGIELETMSKVYGEFEQLFIRVRPFRKDECLPNFTHGAVIEIYAPNKIY